ncbi:MAG: CvpA family protein [Bacteroidota bacterium]|nr:CvpA family protein [Bacteroidota bacterium]
MNFIDVIICIPLIWGLYKGFTKGLIIEAATMIAFGLGVWGGIHFSDFISNKISTWFNWQSPYLPVVSFCVTFLAIIIVVYFIAKMIQRMVEGMALSAVNKIGGAILGVMKFALVLSVVIFVIDAIEKSYPLISFKAKEESLLYKPMGKVAPAIIPSLSQSKVAELIPATDSLGVDVKVNLNDSR